MIKIIHSSSNLLNSQNIKLPNNPKILEVLIVLQYFYCVVYFSTKTIVYLLLETEEHLFEIDVSVLKTFCFIHHVETQVRLFGTLLDPILTKHHDKKICVKDVEIKSNEFYLIFVFIIPRHGSVVVILGIFYEQHEDLLNHLKI